MMTPELRAIISLIENAPRILGLMPRIKSKKDGTPSPTTVANFSEGAYRALLQIDDEQAEYDYVWGCHPIAMRPVVQGEDLSGFQPHHIVREKKTDIPLEVPTTYDGLTKGDVIIVPFGGSGGYLSFALSRRAEDIGATALRITPFLLKEIREAWIGEKPDNATLLVELARTRPEVLQIYRPEDRNIIMVAQCFRMRMFAQDYRKRMEQRMWQLHIGEIFCRKGGTQFPGALKEDFDKRILKLLPFRFWRTEETRSDKRLEQALQRIPFYTEVLSQVEGIGSRIAGGIIGITRTPLRFPTVWKYRKFMGVYCNPDGTFPRMKRGQPFGGNPEARQTLYQLADLSFTMLAGSPWGIKLRENKAVIRAKYPTPIVIRKNLSALWRQMDVFFRRRENDVAIAPAGSKVETIDELYEFFRIGQHKLTEKLGALGKELDEFQDEKLDSFEERINALGSVSAKAVETPPAEEVATLPPEGLPEEEAEEGNGTEELEGGKKIKLYTPGHIHKMALWITLGQFVEWLYNEWTAFELKRIEAQKQPPVDKAA